MKQFEIAEDEVGQRLDVFATQKLPQLSRSSVQKLSADDQILVNNKPARTSYKLRQGDQVQVNYDPDTQAPPDIDLPIIYEDDDCVVVNKPIGVLAHSKGAFNPEGTVASWLQSRLSGMNGEREGIVHRLDRATSGVMIAAKTSGALAWLQKQFSQRKTIKTYYAVIEGTLEPTEAIIDMPIERNPKHPQTFRVGLNGKTAQTTYKVELEKNGYSLVKLIPKTGRTHQLRVHLAERGHPIVGDVLYGGKPAKRLYLHALSLEITLPNKERKTFEAALPASFKQFKDL